MLPAQFSRSNWYTVRTIEQQREEREEEEEKRDRRTKKSLRDTEEVTPMLWQEVKGDKNRLRQNKNKNLKD